MSGVVTDACTTTAPASSSLDRAIMLNVHITNYNQSPINGLAMELDYPTPFENALAATTTCGGTLTGAAGTSTLSLAGGTIAAGGACQVSLTLRAPIPGAHTFTIPAGAVTSSAGASATEVAVDVLILERPVTSMNFEPSAITVGGTSTLVITLSNPNAVPIDMSFHNAYPAGLVNAAAPAMTNSCGGTAFADPGEGFLALSAGTIPANAQCAVTAHVTPATAGTYVNELSAEATFSEDAGLASGDSTSTLVVSAAPMPTASDYALLAMTLALALAAWRALG